MTTKLTLSARRDVVKKVKRLAREQGTSVSAIFDRLARSITSSPKEPRPLGRITRLASGIIALPGGKSERQVLENALLERHGLR
jgi:hypothetical protein